MAENMAKAPKRPELPKKAFQVRLGPAGCSLDLGDGSERAEYVGQDYLLRTLNRPHRSINLMYCYYPYDKGWPMRASKAFPPSSDFAWAYPYDDYFPYEGGPKGTTEGQPFQQIRDVRRHGQDATLTLAIDCAVKDDELRTIARELAPFGKLRVRINHECDGSWFSFNKRYTRPQISDFFIRFHEIIKSEAPDIQTICCWGWWEPQTGRLKFEDDLAPMLKYADVWSIDKYLQLNYAWPFHICEEENRNAGFTYNGVDYVYKEMGYVYDIFTKRSGGQHKPLEICEFNSDGDCPGGRVEQHRQLKQFYTRVATKQPSFLRGITYYQFRDHGRLGMEIEDPNDVTVGVKTPFLDEYRKIMRLPHFSPGEKWTPLPGGKLTMAWRAADDADGLGWKVPVKGTPSFFELKLPKDLNLMVKVNQDWFYKKPGVEWVDATSAMDNLKAGDTAMVAVFAPPADGGKSAPVKMDALPTLRLRYPTK